jgi:hypothetical protein
LPLHDVLKGAAPMPPPPVEEGQIISDEVWREGMPSKGMPPEAMPPGATLPEPVPPPGRPLEKLPSDAPRDPARIRAPFQLEEDEEAPSVRSEPPSRLISRGGRDYARPRSFVVPRGVPQPMPDEESALDGGRYPDHKDIRGISSPGQEP